MEPTMKRLVLIFVLCQLAVVPAVATFEVDDPVQQIEDLRTAEKAGNTNGNADLIALDKTDYLKLIVASYVNGFNEFDTTTWTSDELVKVGIYYDPGEQDRDRAEQLAAQFREKLPLMLAEAQYRWARDVEIEVAIYPASRASIN